MSVPFAVGLGLVLSNVAIIPAIVYAWVRHLFVEVGVNLAVLTASTSFHMCQVEWFCFGATLQALQLTDHFIVYTAVFWYALYFVGMAERLRAAFTIGFQAVTLPVIISNFGTFIPGFIIGAIILVLAGSVLVLTLYSKHIPLIAWRPLVLAFVLLVAGVALHVFGGDFADDNPKYPTTHSLWHMLAMFSIFFVLRIPFKDISLDHERCTAGDHSRIQMVKSSKTESPHTRRKRKDRRKPQQEGVVALGLGEWWDPHEPVDI